MMNKIHSNEKGLTLVEVIVAMALFAITVAALFGTILYCISSNKDSYFAGQEIQKQANAAENYNDKSTDLITGDVAVYNASADGDNTYTLKFDFGTGGVVENDKVYGFQARKSGSDKNAEYRLRFFNTDQNEMKPVPDKGLYWIRIYNYGTFSLQNGFLSPEGSGVGYIDAEGNSLAGDYFSMETMINGKTQIGIDISVLATESILAFTPDYLTYDFTGSSLNTIVLTKTNFDSFCEIDATTGDKTGYVNIYFNGTNFLNKTDYDAWLASPTP